MGNLVPTETAMREKETLFFRLGEASFGLDRSVVRRVVKMSKITPCAREGGAVCGLVSVAGRRVPVYDLSRTLHSSRSKPTSQCRIIVVESPNGEAAFVVDSVGRGAGRASQCAVVSAEPFDLGRAIAQTHLF